MDLYNDLVIAFGDLDYNQKREAFMVELEKMSENMDKILKGLGIISEIESIDRNTFGDLNIEDKDNYLLYLFLLLKKIEAQINDYMENFNN